MIYIYERVSSQTQDFKRQDIVVKEKLKQMGITRVNKIFQDKMTGAHRERKALKEMLRILKKGDVIYVESISRLGRDLEDLIVIIKEIKQKEARVIILKEGIDTDNDTYKLLIAIFGGIAEMERDLIRERAGQRIEQLKKEKNDTGEINTKSGKWFGRQVVDKDMIDYMYPSFKRLLKRLESKEISKVEMAKILGISRATLYRYLEIYK